MIIIIINTTNTNTNKITIIIIIIIIKNESISHSKSTVTSDSRPSIHVLCLTRCSVFSAVTLYQLYTIYFQYKLLPLA